MNHQKMEVSIIAKEIISIVYRLTTNFPSTEKYALTSQMRRAAVSIYLNISEGSSRFTLPDRKRFFEISRGSLIELDAGFEIAFELGYHQPSTHPELQQKMISCFRLLTGLIRSATK